MWMYVLYMGFGMALDPVRLGVVLFLTSRKRPMLNLFAFWLGGIAGAIALAAVVLLLMRDFAAGIIQGLASVVEHVRANVFILTGGRLSITFGVVVLMIVITIKIRERARAAQPVAVGGGGGTDLATQARGPKILAWLAARTQAMLQSDNVWPVFVAGATSSIPPIEGAAVLAVIMASRADVGTQFSAFVVYTLALLVILEIPLVCYLVRPDNTLGIMLRVQSWVQAHLRQIIQSLMVIGGITAIVQGMASL